LPVLTEVNTGAVGLSAADFAAAITQSKGNASQRVAGYIHVLSDPARLNRPHWPPGYGCCYWAHW
jgi:hypothetical protein